MGERLHVIERTGHLYHSAGNFPLCLAERSVSVEGCSAMCSDSDL